MSYYESVKAGLITKTKIKSQKTWNNFEQNQEIIVFAFGENDV